MSTRVATLLLIATLLGTPLPTTLPLLPLPAAAPYQRHTTALVEDTTCADESVTPPTDPTPTNTPTDPTPTTTPVGPTTTATTGVPTPTPTLTPTAPPYLRKTGRFSYHLYIGLLVAPRRALFRRVLHSIPCALPPCAVACVIAPLHQSQVCR